VLDTHDIRVETMMLQQMQTAHSQTVYGTSSTSVPVTCAHECRLFSQWGSGASGSADRLGPVIKYEARKTIYSKGDPARYCYRVVEGAVRLSRILMDGHRQVLDLLLPGDTFGLENTAEYTSTAEAIGEIVVLRCPRACIAHQLATRSGAASHMATILSDGVGSAQEHVAMLTHQGALERVALFLLRFMDRQEGRRTIELPVGRQDMADYLGLTIETTCRSLTELRERGVITIRGRRNVEVRNRKALENCADGDE
jgi:CRP/FNR family nitrogen fixation transcriptional regulator